MQREKELLLQLRRRLALKGRFQRRLSVGIGDDAAIGRPACSGDWVLSSDMLVEDIDFRWRWAGATDVGSKAAAINLSDLAAMGAVPEALLVSVAAPKNHDKKIFLRLVEAIHQVGERFGAPVVGGDISKTHGPWVISVTALGRQHGRPLLRHRARTGDILAVSGPLGAAAAGLILLERPSTRALSPKNKCALVRAQLRPTPHVALGAALAAAGVVHSATDVSDGLVQDIQHLLRPGQAAFLDQEKIPCAEGVGAVAHPRAVRCALFGATHPLVRPQMCEHTLSLAVSGGEDFVLALAIAPQRWRRAADIARKCGQTLVPVGRVTDGHGVKWWGANAYRLPHAFDHFA